MKLTETELEDVLKALDAALKQKKPVDETSAQGASELPFRIDWCERDSLPGVHRLPRNAGCNMPAIKLLEGGPGNCSLAARMLAHAARRVYKGRCINGKDDIAKGDAEGKGYYRAYVVTFPATAEGRMRTLATRFLEDEEDGGEGT